MSESWSWSNAWRRLPFGLLSSVFGVSQLVNVIDLFIPAEGEQAYSQSSQINLLLVGIQLLMFIASMLFGLFVLFSKKRLYVHDGQLITDRSLLFWGWRKKRPLSRVQSIGVSKYTPQSDQGAGIITRVIAELNEGEDFVLGIYREDDLARNRAQEVIEYLAVIDGRFAKQGVADITQKLGDEEIHALAVKHKGDSWIFNDPEGKDELRVGRRTVSYGERSKGKFKKKKTWLLDDVREAIFFDIEQGQSNFLAYKGGYALSNYVDLPVGSEYTDLTPIRETVCLKLRYGYGYGVFSLETKLAAQHLVEQINAALDEARSQDPQAEAVKKTRA